MDTMENQRKSWETKKHKKLGCVSTLFRGDESPTALIRPQTKSLLSTYGKMLAFADRATNGRRAQCARGRSLPYVLQILNS